MGNQDHSSSQDLQDDQCGSQLEAAIGATAALASGATEDWIEEAVRLAEIGEYLYDHQSFSAGNGYDEPREFSINWEWQQSKPHEYGQGVLLAEAAKWHDELVADGMPTVASKLRTLVTDQAELIAQRAALVEAVQGLEWACEQLAATRGMATYDAMIAAGQADAMIALDNARRTARALLSTIQAGGAK